MHVWDAHANTDTHVLTDSLRRLSLTHFAFQLKGSLSTPENHLFFWSPLTLIDKLMEPRGHIEAHAPGNTHTHKKTHTYINVRSTCLNSHTQWRHYCTIILLKRSHYVRPKLAFEYANDSAGSNLDMWGALMWSTSSSNQAAMLRVTQLHLTHTLYTKTRTHTHTYSYTDSRIHTDSHSDLSNWRLSPCNTLAKWA